MATEPPEFGLEEQRRLKKNEGAACEGRPECVIDTHAEGRYQEVAKAWRYAKVQTTETYLGLLRERGRDWTVTCFTPMALSNWPTQGVQMG